ncbi:MAG: radical SAM protein, partial [Acidobacteria bacterium]|nr:radical SAM protein [Acidobacteriota bacterium]
MAKREPSAGLYVHVPFCASICNYCNFNRGLLDEPLKRAYVEAVAREIALRGTGREGAERGVGAPPERIDTIYFGGGTPSLLSPEEAARLLAASRAAFDVDAGAEVTFEVNPETVDRAKLEAYRAAGINRLSFGVQSFDDDELARLD